MSGTPSEFRLKTTVQDRYRIGVVYLSCLLKFKQNSQKHTFFTGVVYLSCTAKIKLN